MSDSQNGSDLDFNAIKHLLKSACERLLREDQKLFTFDVNERSLTHHLAVYLRCDVISEYHIDCEYNRDVDNSKRLHLALEKVQSNDTKGTTIYPDIIVHKRGDQGSNLLVIEAKKNACDLRSSENDANKLQAFTKADGPFKYHYGAFLNFCFKPKQKAARNPKCEIHWYQDGKILAE